MKWLHDNNYKIIMSLKVDHKKWKKQFRNNNEDWDENEDNDFFTKKKVNVKISMLNINS